MVFIPVYILILGFTIVIDYFAGIYIEKAAGRKRKLFLVASLVANIGVLAFFKYYNFLNDNLTAIIHGIGYENPVPYLSIILPIGLSFHTFQAMSYTIEVYRSNQPAERHFGIYALYVMFYPQLVAGPIERPQNMLHQFYEKHYFDYERITDGLKLMAWGLFKKIVIADRLAIAVNMVYNNPQEHSGLSFIIATMFFAFQLLCDFSGYSDIAIGAAQVMGFKLMKNFDRPYQSVSVAQYWSRWHISLSTWFRDYLYFSLGGNRVTIPRWYLNTFIVFLISGLWHGANWTFVIWGGLQAFYIVTGRITQKTRDKIRYYTGLEKIPAVRNALQVCITFILICFGLIFFRAKSVSDAFYVVRNLTTGLGSDILALLKGLPVTLNLGLTTYELLLAAALIIFMEFVHYMQGKFGLRDWIKEKPAAIRWGIYYACISAIIFLHVDGQNQFIYFQF